MASVLSELQGLDFKGAGPPKYERLKSYVCDAILAGRLRPGDALPPEKVLAITLGVARNTVRQAFHDLEQRGLLKRFHGKGTFVNDDAIARLREGPERALNLYAIAVPEVQSSFYAPLLHGFDEAAYRRQHQVIICGTDNDLDKQAQIILCLMDKRVAGVAIVPTTTPPTPAYHIRQLQQQNIPVVLCHRGVGGVHAPLLSMPFREIGRCAGEAAAKRGHRRGALIGSARTESTTQYEKGLREGFAMGGGVVPENCIIYDDSLGVTPQAHEQELFGHLERLCCQANRPTVIFTSFDPLAETIYLLMRRLKLRVPEDISLVGFGGAKREGAIVRRLSSVIIDQSVVSERAVALLEEMRNGQRSIDNDESFKLHVSMGNGETLGVAIANRCRIPRG